jgi:hypothetical protein
MGCSAAGALLTLVLAKDFAHSDPGGAFLLLLMGGALTVNAVYLMAQASKPSTFRPFRLLRLWLDAKEKELRQRANL